MTANLFLCERVLPRAIWMALRGRPIRLLGCRASFSPFQRLLDAAAKRLVDSGRATMLDAAYPELAYRISKHVHYRNGGYARFTDWVSDYYGFDGLDGIAADFHRPYMMETSKRVHGGLSDYHRLAHLAELDDAAGRQVVFGAEADLVAQFRQGHPQASRLHFAAVRGPSAVINALQCAMVVAYCLVNIARRIRIAPPPPEPVFLGADYTDGASDPRTNRVIYEIVDDISDAVMTFRSDAQYRNLREELPGMRLDRPSAGVFGLGLALGLMATALSDGAHIFRHFRRVTPSHFWRLALFVRHRVDTRILLRKFRFRYFYARDDYNVEHIFRTQELRRSGAVSAGVAHGIVSWGMSEPTVAYIDFDIYFLFGEDIYRRYYRRTWPEAMEVRAVGSFGMSRQQIAELAQPRPPNIIFFSDTDFDWPEALDLGFEVAAAFPDRKMFVKLKAGNRVHGRDYAYYKHRIENDAPPNLVWTWQNTYELMLQSCYAISGYSTVAAESLQFGLATFVQDLPPRPDEAFYAEYDGLCVTEAADIIATIRGIEAGTHCYPFERYAGLIDMSGKVVYDEIRAAFGLQPKQPGFRATVFTANDLSAGALPTKLAADHGDD